MSRTSSSNLNFNPRSREGSDNGNLRYAGIKGISIRAPARGATNLPLPFEPPNIFQSALPRGERHFTCRLKGSCINISIRAPARGATFLEVVFSTSNLDFNPRSHEGSDFPFPGKSKPGNHFNPRSHEGSDVKCLIVDTALCNFNPRSHEGSDSTRTT